MVNVIALSPIRARGAQPLTGEGQEQFLRFDDRIATLLTLPGSDPHDVAVRWRQLVDVVSRAGPEEENSAPFIAALAVIRADAERVHDELQHRVLQPGRCSIIRAAAGHDHPGRDRESNDLDDVIRGRSEPWPRRGRLGG